MGCAPVNKRLFYMFWQFIRSTAKRGGTLLLFGVYCLSGVNVYANSANWELVGESSQLNFVSVKATHVAEQHRFNDITGTVNSDGTARLTIDLASVDTGISIRDQRMRDLLFKVTAYPTAQFSTTVDISVATALAVGEHLNIPLNGQLAVQGISVDINTVVTAVKLSNDRFMLSSNQPILLNASAMGLADGVEKLRAIANLPAISLAVPVSFQLLFQKAA
jgi:polyisoprenoid-binding protein YceI